ncbi:MAG: hypothetical protein Tsb0010_06600 [Parvularculaceae bacterium]
MGQIIPPSIVLILLGDVISNAYQRSQLDQGVFAPETVSVGDLFAGALLPGLLLVAAYIGYQLFVAATQPAKAPAMPAAEKREFGQALRDAAKTLPPPLALIIAVLGSILAGVATPTEAAAVGAVGALLIAGFRLSRKGAPSRRLIFAGAASLILLFLLNAILDLRIGQTAPAAADRIGVIVALALVGVTAAGLAAALLQIARDRLLREIADQTTKVTAMVFTILIGAALFSLVFRGLGGDETVASALAAAPGGATGSVIVVMAVMFVLGFFLDFIEITLVVVPLVAPALLALGVDPVWLGVMMAVNLQTSFLTPPFGFSLFYLRGVAPASVRAIEIYRGAIPFVLIQIAMLALLAAAPSLATWLPGLLYD